MDDTVIRNRIIARERARILVSLIAEEVSNIAPEASEAFWNELSKSIPLQKQPIPESKSPMTIEQARVFSLTKMPFGEFQGWAVSQVPMERLEWYADSKFQRQLIRYLNSPEIKAQREEAERLIELDDE